MPFEKKIRIKLVLIYGLIMTHKGCRGALKICCTQLVTFGFVFDSVAL